MSKTTQRKSGVKVLDGHEGKKLEAFMMRFNGHTYAQIEEKTGYTVWYLQQQFYKNGDWYEEYKTWAKDRTDDINGQLSTMFTAQALEAMQQIINISKGYLVRTVEINGEKASVPVGLKDSTILDAAQDVLDRAGFKPPEHITVESESEGMADEIFRKMEERKLRNMASKKKTKLKTDDHESKPKKNT